MILARSDAARAAHQLVLALQQRMARAQEAVARGAGEADRFEDATWLRDGGRHGGGSRLGLGSTRIFDRASVNVSQVHYDDEPDKRLSSATALSTIIHPRHPHAASVHIHTSWTEMRDGTGYWRIMADLNPAIPDAAARSRFIDALRAAAPGVFDEAARQGDRYFYIPALDRHRGVVHFYLEQYATADPAADAALARTVAEAAIDTHAAIVTDALATAPPPDEAARTAQLAYHTVYLFQVLTLDRGTTSGLLVHDQNDVGILGSLPSHVDRALLASWRARVPAPVDQLVDQLLAALPPGPTGARVEVTDDTKRALAAAVRAFYRAHPGALELQARGNVIPPTVANHR
ncbi:MAG TPA: coproporphyrinogen III oxidase [Kofleriaceae bacterium]|nr:coproporphyrinogen III oxidase [Kofleriaceae bacterium]